MIDWIVMRHISLHIILLITGASAVASCSTTKVLADGEYRLKKNVIEVTNDKAFNTNELQSYIRQKPNAWNPLLCVYNWSGKNGDSAFGKFFRKIGEAPVVYDSNLLDVSAENIENHLEFLGYYGSQVNTDVEIRRRKIIAKYNVHLGRQYVIREINYELPERGEIAYDFLSDTSALMMRKGDYLSESLLEEVSEQSASALRGKGYYGLSKNFYSFVADTLKYPGEAILDFQLREYTRNETSNEAAVHKKYNFGKVQLSYPNNFNINKKVLKNLNTVHPGEPYSEEDVNNSYNRLSALKSLSSVTVSLSAEDSTVVDCDIILTPAKQQGFKFNLEGSSNSTGLLGISPELSFFHRNIFNGGELLNLSFMGNFQFKPNQNVNSTEFGVSAGISLPRFVGLPYSYFKGQVPNTDIKLSYNYQDRPEYTRNIISASYGYSGFHRNLNYQLFPLQLNIVRLYNLESGFYEKLAGNPFMLNSYQNHFDLGMGATLYYTTNADINPKTSYHYARFQFGLAGNLLSAFKSLMGRDENGAAMIWNTPFSQYVRSELTLGKTWKFGRNDNYALAARVLGGAGFAYGNSSVLPFEQHFYSGGANSLRGWQARSIGPGLAERETSFIIPNQSGDMKLEANVEFRFPLFWKLNGAAFVDAGNVWTLQESNVIENSLGKLDADTFLQSIATDCGLGLRIDLNFILVRFDFGMQFHDPERAEGERWITPELWLKKGNNAFHFGVGYPF